MSWPRTHQIGSNEFWNLDIHAHTGVVDGYTTAQALHSPSTCPPVVQDLVTTIGGTSDHDSLCGQEAFITNLSLDGLWSDITSILSPISTSMSDTTSPHNLSAGTQAMFGNSNLWSMVPIELSAEIIACSVCRKPFPRQQRAEACQNKHLHEKPHPCKGICGKNKWYIRCICVILYPDLVS